MIENVGFLDQTKNVVTDEDFQYKTASFAISYETPLSSLSDNFCVYNKFYCLLNGILTTKGGVFRENTQILKLPVKPLYQMSFFADREYNNTNKKYENMPICSHATVIVETDGTLKLFANTTFLEGERLAFNFVIPLSQNQNGGGVTLSKLLSLLSLKFRKVVAVC